MSFLIGKMARIETRYPAGQQQHQDSTEWTPRALTQGRQHVHDVDENHNQALGHDTTTGRELRPGHDPIGTP